MPTAIMYALQILQAVPSLIAAGKSVTALVTDGAAAVKSMQAENRDPTPAEWATLDAQIKALRDELHTGAPGS